MDNTRLKETALDPDHQHYWGLFKKYKRYVILKCQVCGKEEKHRVDWNEIPKGEDP